MKTLSQLRNGLDFVQYARRHGADIRNGKGSHCIVSTSRGQTVVPRHSRDLGTGLRAKLVKTFTAIGLSILAIAIVAVAFAQ
jgi:predicted RNA binding protein YcfA (HicA-like mRNA interferase family)